jgi:hypothetical protein
MLVKHLNDRRWHRRKPLPGRRALRAHDRHGHSRRYRDRRFRGSRSSSCPCLLKIIDSCCESHLLFDIFRSLLLYTYFFTLHLLKLNNAAICSSSRVERRMLLYCFWEDGKITFRENRD